MSGAAGRSEAPAYLTDYPSSSSLTLKNTLAFAASDLLLLTDQETRNSAIAPCLLSQVSSSFSDGVVNAYSPSMPEWLLGFGGLAVAGLIVTLTLKLFPILPARLDSEALGKASLKMSAD